MRKYLVGALVGAVLATAIGGFAYAATIPTAANTINGCYSNSSGALRVATTPCDVSTETPISWQTRAFRIHKSVSAPGTVVVFNHYGFQLQIECLSDPNITGDYNAFLEAKISTAGPAKLTGIIDNMDSFQLIDMDLTTSYQSLFRADGHLFDNTDALVEMNFVFTGSGQVVSIPLRVTANGGKDACTADGTATPT